LKALSQAILAAAALVTVSTASAYPYPVRPVRLIVPFTPGGPSDVLGRIIAQKLSENLGKEFYVENMPGGGTNIGMEAAAKAKPDGHSILIAVSTLMVNPLISPNLPYRPMRDFSPVTLLGVTPFVLVVNPAVPVKDAQELIAHIKASPGKYNFASTGFGTTPHLLGELLNVSFDLDLVHVPFNGAGPATNSTLVGSTPIYFASPTVAVPLVREGKLRALAITSMRRLPELPEIPTVAEVGLPGEGADTMFGALVPVGTPTEIIDLLHTEMVKVIADAQVRKRFATLGVEPVGNTPDEFRTYINSEIARWGKVVRDAKIRSETQ
jgi:tripartite-type tricarboxylate transporter receptor subunit TctC